VASIRPGSIVADIRGAVGDVVYSRNLAGAFARTRNFPEETPSDIRDLVWICWKWVAKLWSFSLTAPQRLSWTQKAVAFPLNNRWGKPIPTTGIHLFMRHNMIRYYTSSAAIALTAPIDPPIPQIDALTAVITDPNYLTLTIPIQARPQQSEAHFIYVQQGLPMPASRNCFNGPWRYSIWGYVWFPDELYIENVPLEFPVYTGWQSWFNLSVQNAATANISSKKRIIVQGPTP